MKIINNTENTIDNLFLKMESSLDFIKPKEWQITSINPENEIIIKDRTISIDGNYLRNLEESVSLTITFSLFSNDTLIEKIDVPIQLLAYNE